MSESEWSEQISQRNEGLTSMQAMDTLFGLARQDGQNALRMQEAINNHQQSESLIRAMAYLTEDAIVEWINKMVPDHDQELIEKYYESMYYFRNVCRASLHLSPIKKSIN